MGRKRGQRNRDQDRYWHERRKAQQAGMVGASDVLCCSQCGHASAPSEMFHGWCLACMSDWRATADPVMLAQAAAGYSPASCLPAPSSRDVERILSYLVEPKVDKEFLPLLLFLGNGTVGRMQSLWNFCKTMEFLEIKSTAEVFRLTKASHDLVHRCGLHAAVQKTTLDGFFSRVFFAENFKPIQRDKHLSEYMRWFADKNRLCVFPRTRISAIAEWKSQRSWRTIPKIKHTPLREVWPYLDKEAAKDHLDIMLVDSLVPKGIPEQWRQDMCQDLFVAVLSGELDPEELRNGAHRYMRKVWKDHPYKYGHLSLDAPIHDNAGDLTLGELLSTEMSNEHMCCHTDTYDDHVPATISTMGDILRNKNNGVALPDAVIPQPELMDEDIAEVYRSDVNRKTERTERGWAIGKVGA